ncbi:MAG: HAMP domain-containing histidine kinase [Methylophilaceae bacterium]|nr:HAMP domain-containing histidine kinase [Methylophilaceae bacterium]
MDYFLYTYLPVFSFALATGFIFDYGNKKGVIAQEKANVYKTLAGSIAHEIRSPLNTINVLNNQINDTLQNLENEMLESINEIKKQNQSINKDKPKK